ncbi:protein OCTOPUS-like [Lotus japonicus]|uniref:protein OCTOPUS-like n=1 Tax=Lotus japonicus TaxID=34305 RepID=UPI00258C626E|nr:protein OCTOPUS-like [Lotus japonicus]
MSVSVVVSLQQLTHPPTHPTLMTPTRHRFSTCNRHPAAPVTGFCASCLHERLAGFHFDHSPPSPNLRRTQSRSTHRDPPEPRRYSSEVRPRSSLSDLFGINDDRSCRNRKPEADSANSVTGTGEATQNGDCSEGAVRVCDEEDNDEETKTMKEFIDLELKSRNNSGRDFRSFRHAFSEKFRKWKWKHKVKKKNGDGDGDGNGSIEEVNTEQRLRETQSEVGECRLGRRSCDTDPGFSMSMETRRRISVDWPRVSCDGCLIGKPFPCSCSCSRLSSIDSDVNNDNGDLVEESGNNVGFDELKLMSNAKVSPSPTTTDLFCEAKLVVDENDLSLRERDTNVKSPDCVIGSSSTEVRQKGLKKFHKWGIVWNKLGIEDKLRRVVNVRTSESVSQKLVRSYSVSCRNTCRMAGLVSNLGAPETNGNVLNGKQEFTLHRNRSVGYSPSNLDTGLLRFYLTPLKRYRRSKSGKSSVNG